MWTPAFELKASAISLAWERIISEIKKRLMDGNKNRVNQSFVVSIHWRWYCTYSVSVYRNITHNIWLICRQSIVVKYSKFDGHASSVVNIFSFSLSIILTHYVHICIDISTEHNTNDKEISKSSWCFETQQSFFSLYTIRISKQTQHIKIKEIRMKPIPNKKAYEV